MAEIDSLDIKISAEAKKANDAIDSIIDKLGSLSRALNIDTSKLGNIGKNLNFGEITNSAKTMSENVSRATAKVAESMKPIETQAKKVSQTIEQTISEVSSKYQDLGKGFEPSDLFTKAQNQLTQYKDLLQKAKLSKESLEASGDINTKSYDTAVKKFYMYSNIIENVKEKIEQLNNTSINIDTDIIGIEKSKDKIDELLTYYKQRLSEIETDVFKNRNTGEPLGTGRFENLLEELEKDAPQLEEIADSIKANIEFINSVNKELKPMDIDTWTKGLEESFEDAPKVIENATNEIYSQIEKLQEKFKGEGLNFKFFGNTKEIEEEIVKVTAKLERLLEIEKQMISSGKTNLGSGFVGNIENLEMEISKLSNIQGYLEDLQLRTEKFNQSLQQIKVPDIKEENIEKLQKALMKTYADLEKLQVKLANGLTTGKITENIDDSAYRNLREQIALTEKQAEALRTKISEVSTDLESSTNAVYDFSNSWTAFKNVFTGITKALQKANKVINSVLSKLGKLIKSMFLLGNSAKSSGKGFNLSLMTILKYGLGIRSLYVLFNRLRGAVKEGMENLIQYSDRTNQSVSMLKSSLNQFKNSAAAAFAPILNAIAPALNTLIQLFIRATNAVNQFFAALTGQSTWIKAKYVYDDVAESIGGAAKAAKGALQPFDKLNNLTSQTGAGGGGALPEDMFETKPIEDKFKNFLDWLKSMWDKADFTDLGSLLGQKLKDTLDNIPWTEIKEKARKLAKSLATLINGFIETEGLGYSIGKTLAEAINTAYEFLNEFVHTLHWESVGHFIADTLNGFFESIDWELIRDTFVTGFKGLADAINKFIADFHWDNISNTISNAINTIAETVYTFFSTVKWGELGKNLGEQLRKSIEKIDWEKVGMALGSVVQAALDFLISFVKEQDLSEVAKAIMDTLKGFFKTVDAGDLATVILTVIAAKLALKATKFAFANAAKSILGGLGSSISASAATTGGIAAAGASIGTILIGGIAGVLIGGEFGKLLDNYILAPLMSFDEELSEQYKNFKWFGEDGFFKQFKDSITDGSWKEALELWGQDIKTALDAIGEKNFTGSKEAGENIIKGLNEGLADPTASVSNKMGELCDNAISSARNTLGIHSPSTVFEEIGKNVILGLTDGISSLLGSVNEIWQTMKNNAVTAWSTMREKAATIFSGIQTTINNAINSILTKINTLVQKIKGISGAAKSALGGGIGSTIGGAIGGRTATYNAGISTASLYNYEIPTYATGGFPEDGLFMANHDELVGEFSNGKTAVVNDGQIIAGIEEAAYRGMMRALSESGGMGGNSNVNVTLEGDAANLFKVFQRQYKSDAKRKGITSLDPVLG